MQLQLRLYAQVRVLLLQFRPSIIIQLQQLSDNEEMAKGATQTIEGTSTINLSFNGLRIKFTWIEGQFVELQKIAVNRLLLVVLDGAMIAVVVVAFLCYVSSCIYSRHVGRRARTTILVHRSGHCIEASCCT